MQLELLCGAFAEREKADDLFARNLSIPFAESRFMFDHFFFLRERLYQITYIVSALSLESDRWLKRIFCVILTWNKKK